MKRREQQDVCRRTLKMMPPGRGKRGKLKLRWMDCVSTDMKITCVTENDASEQRNWRRRVQDLSTAATSQQSRTS